MVHANYAKKVVKKRKKHAFYKNLKKLKKGTVTISFSLDSTLIMIVLRPYEETYQVLFHLTHIP